MSQTIRTISDLFTADITYKYGCTGAVVLALNTCKLPEIFGDTTHLLAAEKMGQSKRRQPNYWLYTVAKNKAKDHLKHTTIFTQKISVAIKAGASVYEEIEIDLSEKNINDSQLQMMFAICQP